MEFIVKQIEEDDYDNILVGWWREWGWEAPPKDFLPDNGCGGIMIYEDETPICAGFMYATNSRVACIDFIISNKNYTHKQKRKDAITLLINKLTSISKESHFKYGYALIKHKGLIKKYEELGYVKGDSYTSEMIKLL